LRSPFIYSDFSARRDTNPFFPPYPLDSMTRKAFTSLWMPFPSARHSSSSFLALSFSFRRPPTHPAKEGTGHAPFLSDRSSSLSGVLGPRSCLSVNAHRRGQLTFPEISSPLRGALLGVGRPPLKVTVCWSSGVFALAVRPHTLAVSSACFPCFPCYDPKTTFWCSCGRHLL